LGESTKLLKNTKIIFFIYDIFQGDTSKKPALPVQPNYQFFYLYPLGL